MIEQSDFRQAIARFATGVTVVTTSHQGHNYGMTLSAMTSLCLDPAMLLICVNKAAPTRDAIAASNKFVVNVLADYQERLARRFAKPADNKFAGVETFVGASEIPILAGTLAYFECTVTDRMTGGTHTIFIGQAEEAQVFDRRPLLYYGSDFGRFHCPDEVSLVSPTYIWPELADTSDLSPMPSRLGLHYWS